MATVERSLPAADWEGSEAVAVHRVSPHDLASNLKIWHIIEHDLHHGGELSFSLGMHGLTAPDL